MSKNSTALLLLASLALPNGAFAQSFDLVIAGGRVMDPETGRIGATLVAGQIAYMAGPIAARFLA